MVETPDKKGDKNRSIAMLHIPVWGAVIGLFIIIMLFILALSISGKNRKIYKETRMTATQQWIEEARTLTRAVQDEQGIATQAAQATQTPTPTQATPLLSPTTPLTETPALKVGSTQISPVDGMTMLFVPSGSFKMGYEGGDAQNRPVHAVYLDNYWIDQTEISLSMYYQCVSAGKCTEPITKNSTNVRTYYGDSDFDNYPVINVSWFQAKDYCDWAGRQLPTEAQWKKAARGDDGRLYPWGDKLIDDLGNFTPMVNGFRPVGSYPGGASPYGILQMSGNAYEWVADWFDKDFYQMSGDSVNPTGPAEGSMRSIRGGLFRKIDKPEGGISSSWSGIQGRNYRMVNVQSGYRMFMKPDGFSLLVGFRCAAGAQ
jgi:formylglycine-generating enzyme required for sulfatase activity